MTGSQIKLRWLEYFVAVADELNFGRAAARVHVSAPALSNQIRELERTLGVELFNRTTRTVRLTPAGRRLYAQVRPGLDLIAAGVADARGVTATGEVTMTVGFVSALAASVMPAAARRFRDAFPRTRIRLEQIGSLAQLERLAAGTLDVGLHWRIGDSPAATPLRYREVGVCPLHVALPAAHPLADCDELRLGELAGEEWLMASDGTDTELRAGFVALCSQNGFIPSIRNEATWISSLQALVAAGAGICTAPGAAVHPPAPGVVLRPLVGCPVRLIAAQPLHAEVRADTFVDQIAATMAESLAA